MITLQDCKTSEQVTGYKNFMKYRHEPNEINNADAKTKVKSFLLKGGNTSCENIPFKTRGTELQTMLKETQRPYKRNDHINLRKLKIGKRISGFNTLKLHPQK
jgi:hypothetical protein